MDIIQNRNILDFMSKIQEFYCIEGNLNDNFLNFKITKNFFNNANIAHDNYLSVYYIVNGKLTQRLNEVKELKKYYLFVKINSREKYINVLINKNENIIGNEILLKINNIKAMRSAIISNLNIKEFPLINYFLKEKNFENNNSVNEKILDKIYELHNLNNTKLIDHNNYIYHNINNNINSNVNINFKDKQIIKDKKIEDLEKLLNAEKNKNKELNLKINNLERLLNEDKKEIEELKEKLSRYPFELLPGEKIISIIFNSTNQDIQYSIICKNTELFVNLELKLYKEYPKYTENENFFTVNGKKINKYKSLEENKIKNNDIILLNPIL